MIFRIFSLSLLCLLLACSPATEAPVAEKVDVSTFSEKLESLQDVQLVDVRTAEEFAGGAIENAMNIDFYGDDFDTELAKLDKKKPVMVYCQAGAPEGRSGQTMAKLKELGFQKVYELDGGYLGWANK
ncbi:MAG: rhodanese-like domain-containing protein [Cyanothece sp. SIO1E1]|nr:rhodanese-like domain-containing protein [Cyanothece sp. SIO1E1]